MANWNLIRGIEGKFSSQDVRKSMLSYIIKNYPAKLVEFIEKDFNRYRIAIRGGESLIFDLKGQFVEARN